MKDQKTGNNDNALASVIRTALITTAGCLLFSLALNYLLLFSETLTPFARSTITAIVLPIVIGGPLSFLFAYHMQQTRRHSRELTRLASRDPLTSFFNGNIFASLIDRRVAATSKDPLRKGAFLVVNADNLSAISMRYGFDWGNETVRLLSSAIRSSVRSDDIVGRLGTSEFGIFLPGATEENAREVGERIRSALAQAYFAPGRFNTEHGKDMLKISVAGVMFESEIEFETLYRAAGEQLPAARDSGAVRITHIDRSTDQPGPTSH